MKHNMLRISFLLFLFTAWLVPSAVAQQEKLPQDPAARQQIMHALRTLRNQMPQLPAAQKALQESAAASKFNGTDSLDTGAIIGRIEGFSFADSSGVSGWVIAVAAHLHEDPTAWAIGDVKEDGEYIINGLKTGSYLVMAGADGFFPQFFSHAYNIWEAIIVEVAPNEITGGIDFFLEPNETGEGSIAGQIIAEETGEPIANAQIYAYNANNPFVSIWASTNDDGTYELPNLRTGEYYVQASATGFFSQYFDSVSNLEDARTVGITDGEVTSDINFALNRGGTISGTVVDAAGDPVAGVNIQAYTEEGRGDDSGYWYGWASTDAAGEYTISGLNDGDYIISAHYYRSNYSVTEWYDNAKSAEDATPVPVSFGSDTPNVDFTMDTPTEFGSISGTLTGEDGSAVQSALVRLESIDSPNFYFFTYAYPDENGKYSINEVPVGTYRVVLEYWTNWFYDILWYDQATSQADATPVDIAVNEQRQDINFVIPISTGVLSGIVTNTEGKPIANAYIQLNNAYRENFDGDSRYVWAYANTDAEGKYEIEGLPDGEYILSAFSCYFWECAQQWWPGVDFEERAVPVVIKDGVSNPVTADFELPLELGNASIAGAVTNEDGEPLAGALISIAPNYINRDSTGNDPDYPWITEMHTYADEQGNYAFNYLPGGEFILYASYWEDGASGFEWYEDAADLFDATPIVLSENDERVDLNFALDVRSYYGSLAGSVTLEDGSPINRAYVEISSYYRNYDDRAIYPSEWYGITDANGDFQIDRLFEGEYMVSVYAQGAIHESVNSDDPGGIDSSGVDVTYIKIQGGEITRIEVSMIAQNDGPAEIGGMVTAEQGDALEIGIVKAIPVTDEGAPFYTAITDENGIYRLTGMPEGEYYVQARGTMHIAEYYNNTSDPAAAELVNTQENAPAEGIDFSLEPFYYFYDFAEGDADGRQGSEQASIIYGTVHDENGETLAGATVFVVDESGEPLLSTETFEDGMYELIGIQPGLSYRVKATHAGYESQFNDAKSDVESAPAVAMNSGSYEFNFELEKASTSVANEDTPTLPNSLKLLGNYPNPFAGTTNISFSLPQATHVSIEVYDALGRRIERVHNSVLNAGAHNIRWNAASSSNDLPSGLYFYRVTTGNESLSGSMTILR
ncbi:MAG: carboxypeptidase regulatory-like domain-containing protein [Rhodothermales bacterium]